MITLAICLLILLILFRFFKRKTNTRKSKPDQEFTNNLFRELRAKAAMMNEVYESSENQRIRKDFGNVCYTLHKMTRGPDAISRKNFPTRMRRYGYINAVNKRPIYRYKYLRGKLD